MLKELTDVPAGDIAKAYVGGVVTAVGSLGEVVISRVKNRR